MTKEVGATRFWNVTIDKLTSDMGRRWRWTVQRPVNGQNEFLARGWCFTRSGAERRAQRFVQRYVANQGSDQIQKCYTYGYYY